MRDPSMRVVDECLKYSWCPKCQPVRWDSLVRWSPIYSCSGTDDFGPFQIRFITAIDYLELFDNVRYKVQIRSEIKNSRLFSSKLKKVYTDRIGTGYCPFTHSSTLNTPHFKPAPQYARCAGFLSFLFFVHFTWLNSTVLWSDDSPMLFILCKHKL